MLKLCYIESILCYLPNKVITCSALQPHPYYGYRRLAHFILCFNYYLSYREIYATLQTPTLATITKSSNPSEFLKQCFRCKYIKFKRNFNKK